jgi:hypothetical protein
MLKIRAINASARTVKKLDIDRRERWGRWRELTRHWDPLIDSLLRAKWGARDLEVSTPKV